MYSDYQFESIVTRVECWFLLGIIFLRIKTDWKVSFVIALPDRMITEETFLSVGKLS